LVERALIFRVYPEFSVWTAGLSLKPECVAVRAARPYDKQERQAKQHQREDGDLRSSAGRRYQRSHLIASAGKNVE
jgi:hypothetical protein